MEKMIKLIMCKDKSIKIFLDNQEKHTIDMQNRSIDAEKLFEIMDFSIGNSYIILSENEDKIDVQVLEFFTELFTEIVNKVNLIKVKI